MAVCVMVGEVFGKKVFVIIVTGQGNLQVAFTAADLGEAAVFQGQEEQADKQGETASQ